MNNFDYEVPHLCQYGVPNGVGSDVDDCQEPAPYKVWWDVDGMDAMFVCQEHFNFIKKTEEKDVESV